MSAARRVFDMLKNVKFLMVGWGGDGTSCFRENDFYGTISLGLIHRLFARTHRRTGHPRIFLLEDRSGGRCLCYIFGRQGVQIDGSISHSEWRTGDSIRVLPCGGAFVERILVGQSLGYGDVFNKVAAVPTNYGYVGLQKSAC